MATIILATGRSRARPPGKLRINWNNDLVKAGLLAAWVPDGNGLVVPELVFGRPGIISGNGQIYQSATHDVVVGTAGAPLRYAGVAIVNDAASANVVNCGDLPSMRVTTSMLSVVVFGTRMASAPGQRGDFITRWQNGGTAGDQFTLVAGISADAARFYVSNGSATSNSGDTPDVPVYTPFVLGGGYRGGASPVVSCYVNGNLKASNSSSVIAITTVPTAPYRLANSGAQDGHFGGMIYAAYVFNRDIGGGGHQAAADNPWQLVESVRAISYFVPTAAAATVAQRRTLGPRVGSRQAA